MKLRTQKTEDREQKSGNGKQINIRVFLVAGLLMLMPAAVMAAEEGGEHGGTVMDWVWRLLNFGILFFVLVKFLNKPLRDFLQQRKELIEKSIHEAQEAKELARKALAEVDERLKLKDKEVADIIASAGLAGEREKARLIEEGDKLKVKILEQAKTNIDFEVKRAKEIIKEEAVEAAVTAAEEKIRGRLTRDDQDRLLDESLKLLSKN